MKKTVVAFVLGALLSACVFAYADQPIKLIVNGQEVASDPAPIMHQDRVFIPVRFVAEALGADVTWDEEQNAVIVTTKPQVVPGGAVTIPGGTITTPVEPQEPAKEGENVSSIQTYERDGELFVIEDGIEYYPAAWISGVIYSKGYSLKFKPETKEVYMTHNDDPGMSLLKAVTVLENIPYKIFNGRTCIQKDYYENTILPLVK